MKPFPVYCVKCGKPLIKRYPGGAWHFVFGKRKGSKGPVVDMIIHGSLRLKCWHEGCGHDNNLSFFPNNQKQEGA